ncbi:polysaccharide deacetylase [Candidatus Saccharibacteria bacterium]|nr:polysaccharide deacetylase [Candidatus Saccharibacteria bacterium]
MEPRQMKIRKHKLIISSLVAAFGVTFFSLIGTLMASEIVASQAVVMPERSWYSNYDDLEVLGLTTFEANFDGIDENFEHTNGTIYLTFDDGPGEYTDRLLDILKSYNVKATFFVTGKGDDATIKREYDEGHTVALHTFSHRYDLVYRSVEAYFNDLNQVAERVKNITGEEAKIIRFPGGSSNAVSAKYDGGIRIMSILSQEVLNRGYVYFDWNVASGDAASASTSDAVFVNVAAHLKEGANVVLQHDIKGYSVDAVGRIIEYGLANGYDFQPLKVDSPVVRHGVNN